MLNAEPSQQAARFKAAGVGDVRLWDLPYTTLRRRVAMAPNAVIQCLLVYVPFMSGPGAPLYKGRIIHLKGRFFEEREAIAYYQRARPRSQTVAEDMPKFAKASFETLSRQWKPPDRDLTPLEIRELKTVAAWQAQQLAIAIIQGKLAASYWLGLTEYEQGDFAAALDYFGRRTLQFGPSYEQADFVAALDRFSRAMLQRGPKIFWATGAYYNIARSLEAIGQRSKAVEIYESIINLHNDTGNLVRARWLKELEGRKDKK